MPVLFLQFIFLSFLFKIGNCGDFISDRKCATLFSEYNFQGESFILKDFDRTVNTKRDYRTSIDGWVETRSIKIEENCRLNACSDTNFKSCNMVSSNSKISNDTLSNIKSAECTCRGGCTCEDIILEKKEIGRAYIGGGCNVCHAEYITFNYRAQSSVHFPGQVEAIVLRSGCNITVYSDKLWGGESFVISTEITENFDKKIRSYNITCDPNAHVPRSRFRPVSDVPVVQLPEKEELFLELVTSNESMYTHPGLQAALKSYENGRSYRHVYVFLIGPKELESSLGLNCGYSSYRHLSECRMEMTLPELGIGNAEMRIIMAYHPVDGQNVEQHWMAVNDDYLSYNKDLKNSIPNAVIVHEYFTQNDVARFKRKLNILNALRGQVLDENYSNLIFTFSNSAYNARSGSKIEQFEEAINGNWSLPKPSTIIVNEMEYYFKRKVNGFARTIEGDYFPLNIKTELLRLTEKSGDPFGHAVIKAAYESDLIRSKAMYHIQSLLLPNSDGRLQYYRKCFTSSEFQNCSRVNGKVQRKPILQNLSTTVVPEINIFPSAEVPKNMSLELPTTTDAQLTSSWADDFATAMVTIVSYIYKTIPFTTYLY